MRVMVFVKATPDSENAAPPDAALMQAMGKFNIALHEAGILLMAEGLKPTSHATRIAFNGQERTLTNGPFTDPHTLIAGFWLWEVKDMDEARAWAERCPNPMPGRGELEIRPLFTQDELESLLPPDIVRRRRNRQERAESTQPRPQTPRPKPATPKTKLSS